METNLLTDRARQYLGGAELSFGEANGLWKDLKKADELHWAQRVLGKIRKGEGVLDGVPSDRAVKAKLCQQHAECTSKDPELPMSVRHDEALAILNDFFDLKHPALDGDAETLGIAGGICKRRWKDLGQHEDLRLSATYYERGARGPVGHDGYAHINAAFVKDLLARASGDEADAKQEAARLRERILREMTPFEKVSPDLQWWNAATRAEALFGLGRYEEAAAAIAQACQRPEPWKLRTTVEQFAALAQMQDEHPFDHAGILAVFEKLLPGSPAAARSALIGKVGLALSGGGFRAAYFHLGVLARLAELDVLRSVDVLSCVSGGSIVGACYWLMLRRRLLEQEVLSQADYIALIEQLIEHVHRAVGQNLRGQVQPTKMQALWHFVTGGKGALDTEKTAEALEQYFYAPLWDSASPRFMHQLRFKPKGHNSDLTGSTEFHPGRHNWLRKDKVPILTINATTVNTGHAWQFTPTWMGESPWSTHPAADSVPRLEWHWYEPSADWQISLARAVAASACVPGFFEPLRIDHAYADHQIQLVDGGVHDNQGTVALLAHDCGLLLVSDAAGQLLFQRRPEQGLVGLKNYALRAMDTLMERIRLANYGELTARMRGKLLRGMMFLHMKDGLDADPVRLKFSQESYETRRRVLSPLGVRKDLQQALAELRTDLDEFSDDEAYGLMACGYQMAMTAYARDMSKFTELGAEPLQGNWPFATMRQALQSVEPTSPDRVRLLNALKEGQQRKSYAEV